MALKKCKECGKEISSSAKKCPSCGKDQRNWFMRHKILTGIIALVLIIGVAAAGGDSETASPSNSDNQPKQEQQADSNKDDKNQEKTVEYETVDATEFIAEFDNNQLAAEKKYKDQGIELTAKVSNISEDLMGAPYLSLVPPNADDTIWGPTYSASSKTRRSLWKLQMVK